MHTASWQEKPPAPWLYPPDLLPRIRFRLDLSSQRLSYQKQPLKSLELLYYDGAVQTEENIVSKRFITAKLTTTDKEYYSPQTDKMEQDNSHNVRKKASPFLSGTQIEKVTTEQGESRLDEDDSFWLNEGSDWRRSEEREDYAQRIHPAAAHYALSIVEHLARQGKKEIMILDIAGGNGDLGERIIKDIQKQFPELRIAYRLLDGNKKDVGTANRRFRIFNPEQVTASAFHRDMSGYHFDAEHMKGDKEINLPQEGADIVINCGGMLNKQVANDAEDAINYNRMYAALGEFVIETGYTSLLINSDHHRENNMEIYNLHDVYSDLQIHVVGRPEGKRSLEM